VNNLIKNLSTYLFVVGLCVHNNAIAEWIHIASTLDDDAIFYISSESIKKSGKHTRTVWEVVNHPKRSRKGYLSAKVEQEYDCQSNKVKILYASAHSEMFGKGVTITTPKETILPWNKIPPNSVASIVRDHVCSHKMY
jgi:hypothetical protein